MNVLELSVLKKQFLPLDNRILCPTDKGSIENKLASKLNHHWGNRSNHISVPDKDLIGFALYFICECTVQEWKQWNCPYSLLTSKQVPPTNRNSINEFAILGEDVALIACSLMHWYGSIKVFDILRCEWTFNLKESRLERKGLSSLLID